MSSALSPGLYIVATPIGNLGDLSPRAAEILMNADLVAVEDSRVTARLLQHIGTKRPMTPYHDHNAEAVRPGLIARMASEAVALVSDAGTPLISDPGYKLVRDARAAGHAVVTIPGPCAAVAALTLAGLPTDRFFFLGFLPPKQQARAEAIAEIASVRATLILYESGPRLSACLSALAEGLGDREAAVAREISKKFEECVTGSLSMLAERYADAPPRGEIVVIVGPPGEAPPATEEDADTALAEALSRLPASKAAGEVAKKLGLDRKALYARALGMKDPPLPLAGGAGGGHPTSSNDSASGQREPTPNPSRKREGD
ncbi:16S rRNA (cytidine(1402)-2'-O)-methyltransferase [Stakelama tenebrarum]|uniref:Ribosomal RNA small subunit methyltransferase I n=1 Tax=Stakelama tenebrarum TaxID=2711215 RepID=A0A6G6Y2U8_9SPHN|nr:16S rRNA (cytidine(1402)-2'-O)-methyltransferase [Sphingosinithalassobacter tenebrarum]QIG79274.1 16S rRNA (cytidine(1402)-2'-O)-methyltransferase [Sphingosinithalassobacter tenebrarum]